MTSRWFDGPAGRLDARLHGPPKGRPVLLLHPHPKHGGTKGTRLVYLLCKALADEGFHAIRFDFRGAGRSEGNYDSGPGETADAVAMWDALHGETGQAPIVIGFSFGGGVAVRLAAQRPVPALVLVATPVAVRDSDLKPLTEASGIDCPSHVVIGTSDALVHHTEGEELRAALGGRITLLEGADHFLTPTHQDRAVSAVLAALRQMLDP
jgi:alpha/beta superfamily hydrolase